MMAQVAGSFWNAFVKSSSLITASEIGDRTFFITLIMSVQKSPLIVFPAAMSAMVTLIPINICLSLLTSNVPAAIMHHTSVALFAAYGVKMILDGIRMHEEDGFEQYERVHRNFESRKKIEDSLSLFGRNAFIFMQVFTLIFFAEWGDKSQLSTILLAAREGIWAVGMGAFVAYFICHTIAVLCSHAIEHIISIKRIFSIVGGSLFIVFAYFKYHSSDTMFS